MFRTKRSTYLLETDIYLDGILAILGQFMSNLNSAYLSLRLGYEIYPVQQSMVYFNFPKNHSYPELHIVMLGLLKYPDLKEDQRAAITAFILSEDKNIPEIVAYLKRISVSQDWFDTNLVSKGTMRMSIGNYIEERRRAIEDYKMLRHLGELIKKLIAEVREFEPTISGMATAAFTGPLITMHRLQKEILEIINRKMPIFGERDIYTINVQLVKFLKALDADPKENFYKFLIKVHTALFETFKEIPESVFKGVVSVFNIPDLTPEDFNMSKEDLTSNLHELINANAFRLTQNFYVKGIQKTRVRNYLATMEELLESGLATAEDRKNILRYESVKIREGMQLLEAEVSNYPPDIIIIIKQNTTEFEWAFSSDENSYEILASELMSRLAVAEIKWKSMVFPDEVPDQKSESPVPQELDGLTSTTQPS